MKNWKLVDRKPHYLERYQHKKTKLILDVHHTRSSDYWKVDVYAPANWIERDVTRIGEYKYKPDAVLAARDWMKEHPRGKVKI